MKKTILGRDYYAKLAKAGPAPVPNKPKAVPNNVPNKADTTIPHVKDAKVVRDAGRVAAWKKKNADRVRAYQRELMKKRRTKVAAKPAP